MENPESSTNSQLMPALGLGFGNPSRNRLNPSSGANVTRARICRSRIFSDGTINIAPTQILILAPALIGCYCASTNLGAIFVLRYDRTVSKNVYSLKFSILLFNFKINSKSTNLGAVLVLRYHRVVHPFKAADLHDGVPLNQGVLRQRQPIL